MDKIKGIIFDLDGVLVKSDLNFREISRQIFGEERFPLLENILRIKDSSHRKIACAILEEHEKRAAVTCILNKGIPQLFELLNRYGIKKGLVTRNNRKSVHMVIKRFGLEFDVVLTREDAPPKPAKDPVILACKRMNLSPDKVILLGDYEFDMVAGKRAGIFTVLLKSCIQPSSPYADLTVESIPRFTQYLENLLKKN